MENKVIRNPILSAAGIRKNIAADGGAGPPPRRHPDNSLSDRNTQSNALMRSRRRFIMETFKTCTVTEKARLGGLAHCTFIAASLCRNEAQATGGRAIARFSDT